MANHLNTMKDAPGVIAKAAAKILYDELHFGATIGKADEKDYNGQNGYCAGDTILISKPARFIAQRGQFDITSTQQDTSEEKTPLKLDIMATVGLNADSLVFASEIQLKDYINRVVRPAVNTVAHDVEQQLLDKATRLTFNSVGTPGSNTFDTDAILSAREKINKYLAPKDDNRFFLHDSSAGRQAVGARKGLFQSSDDIAKQYKRGLVGIADGFTWLESEMMHVHTNGSDVTGITIDGTVNEGANTLHIDGLTPSSGTITAGSVFTIAGVYAVHPITKQAYPFLQQFTALQDVLADSSGAADMMISPALYTHTSKGLHNVSVLPVGGEALTFVGASDQSRIESLVYHKEAFRMVSVPLILPTKAEFAVQETYKGLTVAIVRDWDQLKRLTRVDFLGGITPVRPEHACRLPA